MASNLDEFDGRQPLGERLAARLRVKEKRRPDEWGATRVYAPTTGVPGPRDPWLTPALAHLSIAVASGKYTRCVAVTAAQSGKALALDTPIATPDGWTTMGELRVGDTVFGSDGRAVRVAVVSPVMFGHECFEVEFEDGERIVADADHVWTVSRTDGSGRRRRMVDMTTAEMVTEGPSRVSPSGRSRNLFSVPAAGALDLPDADLPIDPYLFGVWLGDGNARAARISVGDEDIEAMRAQIEASGYDTNAARERTCWRVGVFEPGRKGRQGGVQAKLRALGVIANKHIPAAYMRASADQRLALLQGLMDTDGGVEKGTVASFCAAGRPLADQVHEVAASLGYLPRLRRHKRGHWRVDVQCYRETTVFRLPRKTGALRSVKSKKARPGLNTRRSIVAIRSVSSVPVRCIGVDAVDHLFLAGRSMIATHNTDSALDIIGQRLDERPVPILYVGPSNEFNRDQFEPRLRTMIDEAEGLSDKLVRGRDEKKTRKIVNGVPLRLASGGSSTALKSDPAGLAIVDEYDEMMSNIRGQGDVLGLVEARGETYADFLTVITSTPGQGVIETETHEAGTDQDGNPIVLEFFAIGAPEEIESPIWRLFQEGTRHHWAWDCPHCGVPFIPMLKHLKWEKGASPAQAKRTAYLECPANGCIIADDYETQGDYEKTVKAKMNAGGFMIAPGQTVEEARAGENEPDNSTYSQWASGLTSPFVTWGTRAERLVKAEMSGEEDKVQTAVNANFGEVYLPGLGSDLPEWRDLLKHRTSYAPGELPADVLRLGMGVDVQRRGLYFVIRGFGSRGMSRLIQHGYLLGMTDEDQVWHDLAQIMLMPVHGLPIERAMIDSGFRPDKKEAGGIHRVYDFCRQYSFIATPCKTKSAHGGKPFTNSRLEVKIDGRRRPFSIDLGLLDPDYFKSLVQTRIKTPIGQPGAFYLHRDADEEYARQVLSEVRLVTPGKNKAEWKPIRRENHYFDCEALAACAGYLMNVQAIPEGIERDDGDEVQGPVPPDDDGGGDTPPPTAPAPKPAPQGDARDALRKKFARLGANANR